MMYKSFQHHKLLWVWHSDLMRVSNENRKESFWNISKKSIQTVSSSKQKQVSETLISSQDLNYLPFF